MKRAILATLVGLTQAADTEAISMLMNFGNRGAGQFVRGFPGYARQAPATTEDTPSVKSTADESRTANPLERTEKEASMTKAQRNAKAAERDPVLIPKIPNVRPLMPGMRDAWEPVQPEGTKMKSPVFLVDPIFTKKVKEEKRVRFNGNDHGGFNQPVSVSAWPIIREEVQDFFGVGPDCSCDGRKHLADMPEVLVARIPTDQNTEPAWEPQYKDPNFKIAKNQQKHAFKGDDFGGHNIPFPHPAPPKPETENYEDAFIDLRSIFTDIFGEYDLGIPQVEMPAVEGADLLKDNYVQNLYADVSSTYSSQPPVQHQYYGGQGW